MLRRDDFQVYVDGGVRSGHDVLKALCLGANAVGLGRPIIYAATGWGAEGVEKAFMSELSVSAVPAIAMNFADHPVLKHEMEIGMRSLGVTRLDQLRPELLDCKRL